MVRIPNPSVVLILLGAGGAAAALAVLGMEPGDAATIATEVALLLMGYTVGRSEQSPPEV